MKRLTLLSQILFMLINLCAQPSLRRDGISEEDKIWLLRKTGSVFGNVADVEINITTFDLDKKKQNIGNVSPAKISEINRLKKKLKKAKGSSKMNLLLQIGNGYRDAYLIDSANVYFRKQRYEILGQHRTLTSEDYVILGFSYFNTGITDSAIMAFESISASCKDTSYLPILGFAYFMSGNLMKADSLANEQIKKKSTNIFYYFTKYFGFISSSFMHLDSIRMKFQRDQPIHDYTNFSYLENSTPYKSGEYSFKLLWHIQMTTCLLLRQQAFNLDSVTLRTKPDSFSKSEALKLSQFYDTCLQDTSITNRYILFMMKSIMNLNNAEFIKSIDDSRMAMAERPKGNQMASAISPYHLVTSAYLWLNDTASAIKTEFQAIENKPDGAASSMEYARLAKIYYTARDYTKAEKWAIESIKLNSREEKGMLICAATALLNHNLKNARLWLKKTYETNPNNREMYLLYGVLLLEEGNSDEAFNVLEMMRKNFPDDKFAADIIDYFYEEQ